MSKYNDLFEATVPDESVFTDKQAPNPLAEPDEIVARDIELTKHSTFPPMRTPLETPAAALLADAMRDMWGAGPVELPLLGGSPTAAHFRTKLDVPVLVVPYANPDQEDHSPDEHLDLNCFRNGIETSARFLARVVNQDLTQVEVST